MKLLALALGLALTAGCYEYETDGGSAGTGECVAESECCKVCDDAEGSKACGDSCIAGDLSCSAGAGCACDAREVCE